MQRIVVGVDGSETAQRALHWAIDEARRREARLDVIHAWHMPFTGVTPYAPPPQWDSTVFEDEAKGVLDRALAAEDTTGVEVHRFVSLGGAAEMLIQASKGADLVVVGSRGRGGFTGLLLGSVSQQVVHHAPCPVVVIPVNTE